MDDEAEELRAHLEMLHQCRASLRRVVIVPASAELYAEQLRVHIFDLERHPISKAGYAWAGPRVVLDGWFVQSPEDAVREAYTNPGG